MRNYKDELIKQNIKVNYFEFQIDVTFFNQLLKIIKLKKIKVLYIYEIEDKFFELAIKDFCNENSIELIIEKTPMFLVSRGDFQLYSKKHKKPFMKSFYQELRIKTKILMTKTGDPEGGQFSFDEENRKKIPKSFSVIKNSVTSNHDEHTLKIIDLVEKYFSHHPGHSADFFFEVTRSGAVKKMNEFFKDKFENFGIFEDALDSRDPFLYHSLLSPYLNIGFLTPQEVVTAALKQKVSLNSKEGFIRQVIGWREFVRGIYQEFSLVQDESNFFQHHRKLKEHWYQGNTGLEPLDDVIQKVIKYGHCHHIERLMILSNIMLLCEISPQDVHRWFMEMFVDSSDWVMGPNVYGMGQFSDGGIFATKPYICGSNYLLKMGHYEKGEWCEILDGLYWRFIDKNRKFFLKNHRMSMMVKLLDKMDSAKLSKIKSKAEKFIEKISVHS
jgi:deoxyribodipyrimidine photolyase-related protein